MPQATVDQRAVSFTEPASKMTPVKGPATAGYVASNASGPRDGGGGSATEILDTKKSKNFQVTKEEAKVEDVQKIALSSDREVYDSYEEFKKRFDSSRGADNYLKDPEFKEADECFGEAENAANTKGALSNYSDDDLEQYNRIKDALRWQHEMFGDKGYKLRQILEAHGANFRLPSVRKKFFTVLEQHYQSLQSFRRGTVASDSLDTLESYVRKTMFGDDSIPGKTDLKRVPYFSRNLFVKNQEGRLLQYFGDDILLSRHIFNVDLNQTVQ
jgi:hypothetical protein